MPSQGELDSDIGSVKHTETRRYFFRKLGILGASFVATAAALTNPRAVFSPNPENFLAKKAEADASAENLTDIFRRFIETKFTVDDVGYRLSNAFTLGDGFDYMVNQGIVFQRVRDTGEIRPWNTLDVLHDRGYDAFLDDYIKSGVTIPAHVDIDDNSGGNLEKAFNNRVQTFGVKPRVEAFARALRTKAEIGVPTSPTKNYGSYEVTRFQRIAVQEWLEGPQKGLIQRILAGSAFARTGLVPKEALLAEPDVDGWGKFGLQPQPEQPVKTETAVNVPPLPPGGFLYNEQQVAKALNGIPWYRKEGINEKTHTLQLSGKLIDWSVNGNNLVLKIATNKDNLNEIDEIFFVPQDQDSIWFMLSRPPTPSVHYKSTEIATSLSAMNLYFKKGDPIYTGRRIRGGPTSYGYAQQITTWR